MPVETNPEIPFTTRIDDFADAVINQFLNKADPVLYVEAELLYQQERESLIFYEAQLRSRLWELERENADLRMATNVYGKE